MKFKVCIAFAIFCITFVHSQEEVEERMSLSGSRQCESNCSSHSAELLTFGEHVLLIGGAVIRAAGVEIAKEVRLAQFAQVLAALDERVRVVRATNCSHDVSGEGNKFN